ncbi:ATP-grasp domain-containing protein [Anaerosinus massiliensis]|uniref:hypothetical protein n=1 Tax=Massilibacillus massiliensis TaxID=1806837 RepID=UPI000DA63B73|nr:hypothetical protein [Massilibacillus massiliensis]
MKIAVHCDKQTYGSGFTPKWIERLEGKGIEVVKVDLKKTDDLAKVKQCQGAMWHWFHSPEDKKMALGILQNISECYKIPVFPNMHTCWSFDEKVLQNFFFIGSKCPHIQSWLFTSYAATKKFLSEEAQYPLVFKLSSGAGASNVLLLKSYNEAVHYAEKMFLNGIFPYTINEFSPTVFKFGIKYELKNLLKRIFYAMRYISQQEYPPLPEYYLAQKGYFYVQKFLPNNAYDIRITTIGKRTFGFIRYNRNGDFRASGSGVIDYDKEKIPLKAVKIAQEISRKYHFQSMAYDFLLDEKGEPLIGEISYGFADVAIYNCEGYWDEKMAWISGHVWPEYAHVDDFINEIEIVQRNNI